MTTYTNVFGGNAVKPADVSYSTLSLTANATLNWPSTGIGPYTSSIMEISSDAARDVTMPDARMVSPGETVSIKNTGSFTLSIKDSAGGAIVSIASGLQYDVYIKTNTTAAGTWGSLQRGAGTSTADAAALDGAGLEAFASELRTRAKNVSYSISSSIGETERSKVVVWTGGGGAFTIAAAATLTDGWYCFIKNNGSGTLTLDSVGTETFNDAANIDLLPEQGCLLTTNGANYTTVSMNSPEVEDFTYTTISVAGTGTYTLSAAEFANTAIKFTGVLTGNRTIVVPNTVDQYWINNATTGAFTLTVKTSAGAGIAVTQAKLAILYCDGTDVVAAETDEGAGISTPVSIANGGTGATTANGALTNLGGTSTGIAVFGAADAAAARSAMAAAGTGVANNFTADQTISSTDAGAAAGPNLTLDRNSASPAANDAIGSVVFHGRSSTAATRVYGEIRGTILDEVNATEDGQVDIRTIVAGTQAQRVIVRSGVFSPSATGGDQGSNTLNFTTLYEAGVSLVSKYASLAVANIFTSNQTIQSTDAGATESPDLVLDRNSATPAAADILGGVLFQGRSSTAVTRVFARILASVKTATNAAEDGLFTIRTILAGTEADRVIIGAGLYTAGATGGDKGVNTVNASGVYENGVLLTAGGTTLLGTITTTSGTEQSLTSLDLTSYKFLKLIWRGVSTGASTSFLLGQSSADDVVATQATGGASGAIHGTTEIELVTGDAITMAATSATSGTAIGITVATLAITNASTVVYVNAGGGGFDAGNIDVYGIK